MALTELALDETFSRAWSGRDPFAEVDALEGEIHRALENRKTLSFRLEGESYFVKIHRGTSWREVFKNLFQLRMPVISAVNEKRAITALDALGIAVPRICGFGCRGWWPTTRRSFIITRDVGARGNLEELCRAWATSKPAFREKRRLIREVARIGRVMHANGICHRDFYLCHFLVAGDGSKDLTLIDLHRALVKKHLASRWVVKDIGGLYFSAMDMGLGRRDLFRFVKYYSGTGLKSALSSNGAFWETVERRAVALYARHGD